MATTNEIIRLFEPDLEKTPDSLFDFQALIRIGFPVSWAHAFFRNSMLDKIAENLFPNIASNQTTPGSTEGIAKLTQTESDRLFCLARVYADALELFESQPETEKWLISPSIALGNKSPIELLDTSVGFELVSNELQRLNFGIAG